MIFLRVPKPKASPSKPASPRIRQGPVLVIREPWFGGVRHDRFIASLRNINLRCHNKDTYHRIGLVSYGIRICTKITGFLDCGNLFKFFNSSPVCGMTMKQSFGLLRLSYNLHDSSLTPQYFGKSYFPLCWILSQLPLSVPHATTQVQQDICNCSQLLVPTDKPVTYADGCLNVCSQKLLQFRALWGLDTWRRLDWGRSI